MNQYNGQWPAFAWAEKQIIVTGGAGFLGQHVIRQLQQRGVCDEQIIVPRKADYDLTHMQAVQRLFSDVLARTGATAQNIVVIHLAGNVGGIGYNREKPANLFYDNLMMGTQLMEVARQHGTGKFVAIGTICAYPKFTPVPFHEEDL